MWKYISTILVISFSSSFSETLTVSAYYPSQAFYENYQPDDINFSELDEVIFKGAYISVGSCDSANKSSYQNVYNLCLSPPEANFNAISKSYSVKDISAIIKKLIKSDRSVILSIGRKEANNLSIAMQPDYAEGFILSIKNFFSKVQAQTVSKENPYGTTFSGVNIDWQPNNGEWTILNGTNARQILENYLSFIKLLKITLLAKVEVTVPAKPDIVKKVESIYPGFWAKLSGMVFEIDIKTYNYHNSADKSLKTNYNAPLFFDKNQPTDMVGRNSYNIESTVKTYLSMNVDRSKIRITIPTSGKIYELVSPKNNGLYQSFSGDGYGSKYMNGTISYVDIIDNNSNAAGWIIQEDSYVGEASAYNPKRMLFTAFDTPMTIAEKIRYAQNQGLGGVVLADISGDLKKADIHYNEKSLLNAIVKGI